MHQVHAFVHRCNNPDLALLLPRVGLRIVFLYHGWMKVGNREGTVAFFGTLGFAPFFAYTVAWVETLGGLALILGFLTRYAGLLLAVVALVALFKVHLPNGFL